MIPAERAPLTALAMDQWEIPPGGERSAAVVAAGMQSWADPGRDFVVWSPPDGPAIPIAGEPLASRLAAHWLPDAPAQGIPSPVRLVVAGDVLVREVVPRLLECPGVGSVVVPAVRPPGALRRRPWSWPLRIGAADDGVLGALAHTGGAIPPGLVRVTDVRVSPGAVDVLVLTNALTDAAAFVVAQRQVANAVVCATDAGQSWPVVDAQLALIRAASAAVLTAVAPATEPEFLAQQIMLTVRYLSHAHPIDIALTAGFGRSILLVGEPDALVDVTLPDVLRARVRRANRDVQTIDRMTSSMPPDVNMPLEMAEPPSSGASPDGDAEMTPPPPPPPPMPEPPSMPAPSMPAPSVPPPSSIPRPPSMPRSEPPGGGILRGIDLSVISPIVSELDGLAGGSFDHESGTASAAVEVQERIDAAIDTVIAEAPRVLQAYVGEPGAPEADGMLHPGRTAVDVFIGPPEERSLKASGISDAAIFDDPEDDMARLTVVFAPLVPLGEPQRAEVDVPRVGRSKNVRFDWDVPWDGAVQARIIVLHRNRVLQTARIGGAIGKIAKITERIVLWKNTGVLDERQPFDRTFVLNHARRKPRAVTVADGEAVIDTMEEIAGVTALLRVLLMRATQMSTSKATAAKETRSILVDTAVAGRELHRALAKKLKGFESVKRMQIVSASEADFLPLELIYDRIAPDAEATVCANWTAGKECGEHCFAGPGDTSIVCPAVFWGLSRIIERQRVPDDADPVHAFTVIANPTTKRSNLSIARALVAASSRVKKADVARTLKVIGAKEPVTTWSKWKEELATSPADLLVLMPHTDPRLHTLEISGKTLGRGSFDPPYITGTLLVEEAQCAPVAVLFGCDTVGSEEDPAGWVGTFMQGGAAVVFSTLTMLIGPHAAGMSERLVAMLRDEERDGMPLGELVAGFRREALRSGLVAALSVTAYGDADWKV